MSWRVRKCGCIKADLPPAGPTVIRCERHRGKPAKRRLVAHWEDVDGTRVVRRG